jgi:hypothetical protein
MADPLADYWVQVFTEAHGFSPMFERKDAVQLHQLLKHYGSRYALAWAIREFHKQDDPFVSERGWTVAVFKSRYAGLHARYSELNAGQVKRDYTDAMARVANQLELGFDSPQGGGNLVRLSDFKRRRRHDGERRTQDGGDTPGRRVREDGPRVPAPGK